MGVGLMELSGLGGRRAESVARRPRPPIAFSDERTSQRRNGPWSRNSGSVMEWPRNQWWNPENSEMAAKADIEKMETVGKLDAKPSAIRKDRDGPVESPVREADEESPQRNAKQRFVPHKKKERVSCRARTVPGCRWRKGARGANPPRPRILQCIPADLRSAKTSFQIEPSGKAKLAWLGKHQRRAIWDL